MGKIEYDPIYQPNETARMRVQEQACAVYACDNPPVCGKYVCIDNNVSLEIYVLLCDTHNKMQNPTNQDSEYVRKIKNICGEIQEILDNIKK